MRQLPHGRLAGTDHRQTIAGSKLETVMGRRLELRVAAVVLALAMHAPAGQVAEAKATLARFTANGQPMVVSSPVGEFLFLISAGDGPQVVMTTGLRPVLDVVLRAGEDLAIEIPIADPLTSGPIWVDAILLKGKQAQVTLSGGDGRSARFVGPDKAVRLELQCKANPDARMTLAVDGADGDVIVRLSGIRAAAGEARVDLPIVPAEPKTKPNAFPLNAKPAQHKPPTTGPALRPLTEQALIEADWRMQDGIDTPRNPATYTAAIGLALERGDALIADIKPAPNGSHDYSRQWQSLRAEWKDFSSGQADQSRLESLWRRVHQLRRQISLSNPAAKLGPLVFVKQVPSTFSHQLTQVYGYLARPGGGVFVLDRPGESMACRKLTSQLPEGSYQSLEVSYDARRILFAHCAISRTDTKRPFYHLYEMLADGSNLRQLTEGDYDDFSPRYLPNDKIVFMSTRRGGWHRCGSPGCENFTLTTADADGRNIRTLSLHETQEWDPAIMHDGHIIYTRWDYVDRHAFYGQMLWTTRPDGTAPRAFYGNMTTNPMGIWESQPVPGSSRIMATGGAHHAMTAGSIVLIDTGKGHDGSAPLARLTKDTPFPETETNMKDGTGTSAAGQTVQNRRWPGHAYRSPYPYSEKYFLAAFSFDTLRGEPYANNENMFGLYLVDAFGNKELLYRDLNIGSLWAMPLRSRPRPPVLPMMSDPAGKPEGTIALMNVYDSSPAITPGTVTRLRITQVLPKTTSGKDQPAIGTAEGAPLKQVLGTVPVEIDGSAYFTVPARAQLLFQALDKHGMAVQIMRSEVYLQPGEKVSCVGCHEARSRTPAAGANLVQAMKRPPSQITPGPNGSKPYSYPILVQPVLNKHCVSCHSGPNAPGKMVLTGDADGHYSLSYRALIKRVPVSGDHNEKQLSRPGQYGAHGSPLMKMLLAGHKKVTLTPDEIERLATWMDTNGLFYGTFDRAQQRRQMLGEKIDETKLH